MATVSVSRSIALMSLFALVSACSSGPTVTPTTPGPPPSSTSYRDLADRTATAASSTLGGVIVTNDGSHTLSLNSIRGTINHASGATSINDGVYNLVDVDGAASDGEITDGTFSYFPDTYRDAQGRLHPMVSGDYQYVSTLAGQYVSGGNDYFIVRGVYGVQTNPADIPTAGTATYAGGAGGNYDYGTGAKQVQSVMTSGASAVSADFSSNYVSVTMNDFTVLDSLGNALSQSVFDEVRLTNMRISGTQFSGGNIEFYRNGKIVSYSAVIGAGGGSQAGGSFFGFDSTIGAPDEVGGVVVHYGDQGELSLVFIAD